MFNWSSYRAGSKQNHLVVRPLDRGKGNGLYAVLSLVVPELIDDVFDELEKQPDVQDLKILNSNLHELPARIGNVRSLRYIYYNGSDLQTVPDTIGNLRELVVLQIEANKLSQLPESIGNLSQLDRLDLGNNCLTSLPDSFHQLTQLRRLNLRDNRLTCLPADIGDLAHLEYLNLSNNRLEALPDSIGHLEQLNHLIISHNRLTTLPASIKNLKRLEILDVANNRLRELPDSFAKLSIAKSLDLSGNQIRQLPSWFASKLARCDVHLGGNPLQELPDDLKVRSLNLSRCTTLTALPEHLTVRKTLDVGGLSLQPPSESVSYGELRWNGVRINEQIAFYPETITNEDIYDADNIELRRVMIERIGYDTFIQRANPRTLDTDRDPGGMRRLLWIDVRSDEPLVCLNVKCPSTGRDYFLRVPPHLETCHQAAAWIAGFDNPDDYQPVMET